MLFSRFMVIFDDTVELAVELSVTLFISRNSSRKSEKKKAKVFILKALKEEHHLHWTFPFSWKVHLLEEKTQIYAKMFRFLT